MTIRELKISELNHILPIVRMTLEKEEELKRLRESANQLKSQISSFNKQLTNSDANQDWHNALRLSLQTCINELKIRKQQIKEAEDYITASNLLFEGFSQMFNYGLLNCYQNGGVIKVSELKEDYLYEYAYLIQNTSSLTIYRLVFMQPEVMKKVESIVKFDSNPSRKKIREYLKFAIKFDKLL